MVLTVLWSQALFQVLSPMTVDSTEMTANCLWKMGNNLVFGHLWSIKAFLSHSGFSPSNDPAHFHLPRSQVCFWTTALNLKLSTFNVTYAFRANPIILKPRNHCSNRRGRPTIVFIKLLISFLRGFCFHTIIFI